MLFISNCRKKLGGDINFDCFLHSRPMPPLTRIFAKLQRGYCFLSGICRRDLILKDMGRYLCANNYGVLCKSISDFTCFIIQLE